MINIIKSGVGNIGSLLRILDDLGLSYCVVEKPEDFSMTKKIILPGVGSFDSFVNELKSRNLFNEIKRKVLEKNYGLLGICVGMQSLFEGSEEGAQEGFKFIKGNINKFNPKNNEKVPHLGWNSIDIISEDLIFEGIENKLFYFAHSYFLPFHNPYSISTTLYIDKFCSVVKNDKIYGVQFHPEKSYFQGSQLIKNFILKC